MVKWIKVIPIVATMLITGCAIRSSENYSAVLNSWLGKDINTYSRIWGYPAQIMNLPNGNKLYIYSKKSSVHIPETSSSKTEYNVVGSTLYSNKKTTIFGGYDLKSSCTTKLEVSESQKIVNWTWDGNSCEYSDEITKQLTYNSELDYLSKDYYTKFDQNTYCGIGAAISYGVMLDRQFGKSKEEVLKRFNDINRDFVDTVIHVAFSEKIRLTEKGRLYSAATFSDGYFNGCSEDPSLKGKNPILIKKADNVEEVNLLKSANNLSADKSYLNRKYYKKYDKTTSCGSLARTSYMIMMLRQVGKSKESISNDFNKQNTESGRELINMIYDIPTQDTMDQKMKMAADFGDGILEGCQQNQYLK